MLFPNDATTSGYQSLGGTCGESDMVKLQNGNLLKQVTVAGIPGIGFPLRLVLTHNAQDAIVGALGPKWRHNYMKGLTLSGTPTNHVTYQDDSGRQYSWVASGSDWVRESTSYFLDATLTQSGSDWLLTFPNGTVYTFDSSGLLTTVTDPRSNATTLSYTSGQLVSVTEPTGRSLAFSYSGTLLSQVTDPNGNVTHLVYGGPAQNLMDIVGPEGCVLHYDHEDSHDSSVMTRRLDANGHAWQYTYDASQRLLSVEDAESHTISYFYGTETQYISDDYPVTTQTFDETILTDADGNNWSYWFDNAGLPWRVNKPDGTMFHYYWDYNQKLLYQSAPFSVITNFSDSTPVTLFQGFGPRDSFHNIFERFAYDDSGGNSAGLLEYSIDAAGAMRHATHNAAHQVDSVYPAQGHLGVQGNWVDQFGADGYLLCAFNDDGSDNVQLPTYVSSISQGAASNTHLNQDTYYANLLDPRALMGPSGLVRSVGQWTYSSAFTATISLTASKQFNLSVYTASADVAPEVTAPFQYPEQFGRDVLITVTDQNGTYTFHITNNAGGAWVTFPVEGDDTHAITVEVAPAGANSDWAGISAITFDPLDNHRTLYGYSGTGDLTSVTDPLGNQTTMTYNSDGTLDTVTDARSNVTAFTYGDTYKNCTRVTDASLNHVDLTYDLNGNVLTRADQNGHVWTYTYDGKNRLLSVTDPLSNVTQNEYDPVGNLLNVTDANGHLTRFTYTPDNRVATIFTAVDQVTSFTYTNSGLLASAEDANGNTTSYSYDAARRLIAIVRPDTTEVHSTYDGLGRRMSATSPNGNQATVADINLLGASNMLDNPGAEIPDPRSTTGPLAWHSPQRDTTVAHSGAASFKATTAFQQNYLPLQAGARALLRFWAKTTGSATTATGGINGTGVNSLFPSTTPATATISSGTSTWVQSNLQRFEIPTIREYAGWITDCAIFHFTSPASTVWFDDMELYSLSTTMQYDNKGRLVKSQLPNGSQVQWVRDRFGRVVKVIDSRNKVSTMAYDGLNRLLQSTDALGNMTTFTYNEVGSLASVVDGNGNETDYAYDEQNRLMTITYPDSTTEGFTYNPAGMLGTYTNNRSQELSYTYDNANRLIQVLYHTDSSTVQFTHDAVGNLLSRTERNGDVTLFQYDEANRLVDLQRNPGGSLSADSWFQQHVYDAVGNRTEFHNGLQGSDVYNTGLYNTATYAGSRPQWTVPSGGYDSMNRLIAYQDASSHETTLSYDVDGNCTGVTYPNGSPAVTLAAVYDITDRLLTLNTTQDATAILPVGYAYDPANNRIAARVGDDCAYYDLDDANRLVHEDLNRFVERSIVRFSQGATTGIDMSSGTLQLLGLADAFSNHAIQADRWRLAYPSTSMVGAEIRESDALDMVFPRAFTSLVHYYDSGVNPYYPTPIFNYGLNSSSISMAAEHRVQLSGDFDIQVDFSNFQGRPRGTASPASIGLQVANAPYEQTSSSYARIAINTAVQYIATITGASSTSTTTDVSGKFRIVRSGSTITLYYDSSGSWVSLKTSSSFTTGDLWLSLFLQVQNGVGTGSFSNFANNTATYVTSGVYTSAVYDAGLSVSWDSIQWDATTPSGTSVEFQVAVSSSFTGPFTFVGPDGTSSTFFTTSGTALPTLTGQYACYQATVSGTSTATPTLTRVDVLFTGTNTSTSLAYDYDDAGNMTGKVTDTPDGSGTTITETRTINDLNQITANAIETVVTSPYSDTTVSWTYDYDDSGNLHTRSDGTNTTTYTWDQDNRLTLVTLPDTSTIAYTYDVLGRMISRTDTSGTTAFVWDGMNCVMETDYLGNVTRYYIPNGTLMSFDRTVSAVTSTYQIHADAIGSVRKVTDSSGTVQATFDYDAWGNQLASTSDSIPNGGLQYRFVGAYGVRWDAATGLYYMRKRWYDPTLGRFLSRDIIRGNNRYAYAGNNPTVLSDPSGMYQTDEKAQWTDGPTAPPPPPNGTPANPFPTGASGTPAITPLDKGCNKHDYWTCVNNCMTASGLPSGNWSDMSFWIVPSVMVPMGGAILSGANIAVSTPGTAAVPGTAAQTIIEYGASRGPLAVVRGVSYIPATPPVPATPPTSLGAAGTAGDIILASTAGLEIYGIGIISNCKLICEVDSNSY